MHQADIARAGEPEPTPVPPGEAGGAAAACEPGLAAGQGGWIWGDPSGGVPADAPLHALLLAASRVMGAFYASTLVRAGLGVSPAGLGVLRVLLADDGLKSSEVASRGW